MDLKAALLVEHSKNQASFIADYIVNNPSRLNDFMDILFGSEYILTQRAAFVLSVISEKKPDLIQSYANDLIHHLSGKNLHPAVKRSSLRLLEKLNIPYEQAGNLIDICYRFLNSNKEPVAIQIYAMVLIGNFARIYPELKQELILTIDDKWDYSSPAFNGCSLQ